MKVSVNYVFSSAHDLRRWLEKRQWDFDGPEEFNEWLCKLFDEGDTITVRGEEYDYWACWELV